MHLVPSLGTNSCSSFDLSSTGMDTDPLSSWSCLWVTATAQLDVYVVTTSVSLISTKEIGQKQTIIVAPRGKSETDVHMYDWYNGRLGSACNLRLRACRHAINRDIPNTSEAFGGWFWLETLSIVGL